MPDKRKRTVACLPANVDRSALAEYVDSEQALTKAERVYVPYHWFKATGAVSTLFGQRTFAVDCLVNAVSGESATADAFSPAQTEVAAESLLDPRLKSAAAKPAAEREIQQRATRTLRTLTHFGLEVTSEGLVYRPFWRVASGYGRLLVDATTGGWFPLRDSA